MNHIIQKKTYSMIITKNDDGVFIGRCDELHANSEGKTFGEIVENMKEAIEVSAEVLGNATDFNMLVIES